VRRYGDVLTYPVVLKGIHGTRLEARTGKRMVIVNNPGELLAAYAIMEDPTSPNLMIQEYIQGSDDSAWLFNGYFGGEAECHVAYTGRKIRQNPTYTGMTSYGTCEWNQEIAETTVCFLRAIGYHGIVDIDYRFDARDGQYKLLDVNPRIGASFRLFVTESGMDVARALYLDMTSQPVSLERPKDGRTWMVEDKDLLSSYRYIRDGRLSFRQWITSLRRVDEAGYFSFDDPIPSTYMWGNHVKRKLRLLRKYSDTIRPLSTRGSQRPGKSHGETAYAPPRMDVAM
jgi:predicted ATP-grasp superfamily ATP-dependent carboligase